MSYRDWPSEISVETVNQFTLAKRSADETPTEYRITTWSNVFGVGGSVTLEAVMPESSNLTLASISVKRSGPVREERDHLQSLLDSWDQDWAALVRSAKSQVRDYYAEQAAGYGLKLVEMDAEATR